MAARRKKTKPRRKPGALRATSQAAQRRLLLDTAARLLASGDVERFNVRELAAGVGASTTVLYTLFGGRDQILVALYDESLAQLGDTLAAVGSGDAFVRMVQLAYAYRRFALDHPHYVHAVSLMPKLTTMAGARVRESRAYGVLRAAVEQGMTAGVFREGSVDDLTNVLWGMVHGWVTLELHGYFGTGARADQLFMESGRIIMGGLITSPIAVPPKPGNT